MKCVCVNYILCKILTVHHYLVPRLRRSEAQHLLPLHAFMDYIATPLPLHFTQKKKKNKEKASFNYYEQEEILRHLSRVQNTPKYTGCPGENVPVFRRMFLTLKYTDLTQNTYT